MRVVFFYITKFYFLFRHLVKNEFQDIFAFNVNSYEFDINGQFKTRKIEFRKNIDVCREQTIRASTMCTIYLSYMLTSIVLLCIVNSQHMLKIKDLSFAREATRSCLKYCLQSVLENINTCIINLKMINCVDFKRKIHTHARVCLFLN